MNRLLVTERLTEAAAAQVRLELPYHTRQKSRLLAHLSSGEEVGLILERGTVLRGGDRLKCSDGRIVEVVAAPELLSVVTATDAWQLARAAYHLGNRHVDVQVNAGSLSYLHDHVLDDMLLGLGFQITVAQLPFEPESGAYAHAGTSSTHSTLHGHGHSHPPGDAHSHSHG